MASSFPPSIRTTSLLSKLPLVVFSALPPTFPSALPSAFLKESSKKSKSAYLRSQDSRGCSPGTGAESEAGDLVGTMAPRSTQRSGGRSANNHRREADMSAVLSAPQKNELVLLVASITVAMQEHVRMIFDQQEPLPSYLPINGPLLSKTKTPVLIDKSGNIAARPVLEPTSLALRSDSTQEELKKEALAAFQRWQTAITKRVSEIVVPANYPAQSSQNQTKPPVGKHAGRAPSRGLGRSGKIGGGREVQPATPSMSATTMPHGTTVASVPPAATLAQLDSEKRQLLVHSMILLVLSLEAYQAYSRQFIYRLSTHLRLPALLVIAEESRIARAISHAASSAFAKDNFLKRNDEARRERRGKIGNPASGAVLTPLAPPLTNAKIGSLIGGPGLSETATATVLGALGTMSDGGLAACVFFGLCGPRGSAAKTLDTFTKDVQDVGLLPLHGSQRLQICKGNLDAPDDRRLRLTIGISGWPHGDGSIGGPWQVLGDESEVYSLLWEQETLEKIRASISTVASSFAWREAKKEFATRNVLASLESLKWPSGLLKISKIVDNPWSMGMVRADKVGIALADAIINKVHGERCISLLGYGLGARVIYTCLMSLSERRVFGQIENVLLMGTPAPSSRCVWTALRSVVSGRVVNVFSENDFILGFLYRTGCVQFGVAGLQHIQGVYGIENVDASKPLDNHLKYSSIVGRVLKDVGWEGLNMAQIKAEEKEQRSATFGPRPEIKVRTGQPTGGSQLRETEKAKERAGSDSLETQFQKLSTVW